MNTDISGVGVRISFYLQTLFLGQLNSRCINNLYSSSNDTLQDSKLLDPVQKTTSVEQNIL